MPQYLLQADDGTLQLHFFPMAERPQWGERMELDGKMWTRIMENAQAMPVADTHFTSHSLPTHDPDFPRMNEHGEGLFASKQEVVEWLAKKRDQGKEVGYDRPGFR